MGNEESTLNKEEEYKIDNIKAPEFYLNKKYPINGNKTMEDLIKNYIDGNNDSFMTENKNTINIINNDNSNDNIIEEQNLMTPTFNSKTNFRKLENINIFNNNEHKEKVINEEDDNNSKEKENINEANYQIINNNDNKFINNNNQIVDSAIKNKNININININIDIPKMKKSKSIIKSLNESYKDKYSKNKKSSNDENSDEKQKSSTDSETKKNKNKKNKNSDNTNNEDSEKIIIKNEDNNINNFEVDLALSKKSSKEFKCEIKEIKMKTSSLMKDIRKEYKFLKPLGGGHFGTVRKAHRRSEKEPYHYLAIKSISIKNLSKKDYDDLVKEVDIISGLDHPNIIKFYETYHDKYFFHIVMELCQGKEVFDNIANHGYMPEKKL